MKEILKERDDLVNDKNRSFNLEFSILEYVELCRHFKKEVLEKYEP